MSSIGKAKMSAEDRKWKAENDARTLADAEAIKIDRSRMTAARQAARRMAKEEQERATAMKKIAKHSKRRK